MIYGRNIWKICIFWGKDVWGRGCLRIWKFQLSRESWQRWHQRQQRKEEEDSKLVSDFGSWPSLTLLGNQQLCQIVTRSQKNVSHRLAQDFFKISNFHSEQGSLATTLLNENVRIQAFPPCWQGGGGEGAKDEPVLVSTASLRLSTTHSQAGELLCQCSQ